MADLTTQSITIAAGKTDLVAALTAAASGGDTAEVATNVFFVLNNGSGSTVTATIATPGTQDGLAIADATLAVPAGKIGVIPISNLFRNSSGRASITYSAVTTVTVGVFKTEV